MRLLMGMKELDRWCRYSRWLLPVGLAFVVLALRYDLPGLLTALAAMWLGVAGILAGTWREGSGLFLLYALIALMALFTYVVSSIGAFMDAWNGASSSLVLTLDFLGFSILMWWQVRITITAMVLNWRVDHRVRLW